MNKPPRVSDMSAELLVTTEMDGERHPRCLGLPVAGSGGHTRFACDCGVDADWWSPDDSHAYCDTHIEQLHDPAQHKRWYAQDWARYGVKVTP